MKLQEIIDKMSIENQDHYCQGVGQILKDDNMIITKATCVKSNKDFYLNWEIKKEWNVVSDDNNNVICCSDMFKLCNIKICPICGEKLPRLSV